jgi:GNAT superfamily N-acetyltransferase
MPRLPEACPDLAARLEADDRRYFAAGAVETLLPGGRAWTLPGLGFLAAGSVAWVEDAAELLADPSAWRTALAGTAAAAGAPALRVYARSGQPRLAWVLEALGFVQFEETAWAADPRDLPEPEGSWAFTPVADAAGWEAKATFHAAVGDRPDGHPCAGAAWTALERLKAGAGYLEPWLLREGGSEGPVRGAFGLGRTEGLLRLKNLVLHPEVRGRGAGEAVLAFAAARARALGVPAVGCWALAGEAGERLYRRAGLQEVGRQEAWEAPLPTSGLDEACVGAMARDGFAVVRGLVAPGRAAALAAEGLRLLAEASPEDAGLHWRDTDAGGRVADRLDPVARRSEAFAALARDPGLRGLAEGLLGGPAALFKDKFIAKPPGTEGYGLHQDFPYWARLWVPPGEILTLAVALDPVDRANGGLELFPGLHGAALPCAPGDPFDPEPGLLDGSPSSVPVLAPGDVLAFHSLAPHRSGPNVSPGPRRMVFLTYLHARHLAHLDPGAFEPPAWTPPALSREGPG